MDFQHSDKVLELKARLEAFMSEHVYPAEEAIFAEVAEGDRWQPSQILEGLKRKARASILWR